MKISFQKTLKEARETLNKIEEAGEDDFTFLLVAGQISSMGFSVGKTISWGTHEEKAAIVMLLTSNCDIDKDDASDSGIDPKDFGMNWN